MSTLPFPVNHEPYSPAVVKGEESIIRLYGGDLA